MKHFQINKWFVLAVIVLFFVEEMSIFKNTHGVTNVNIDELGPILKSIIITRTKEGATVDEIIDDYFDFTGENLLSIYRDRDAIGKMLRKIDGVWCTYRLPSGPYLWFCSTKNTHHITEMIKKQKPRFHQRTHQPTNRTSLNETAMSSNTVHGHHGKFYQDSINFINKRQAWHKTMQRSVNHPYMPPQMRFSIQGNSMRRAMFYPTPNYYSKSMMQSGPTFCGMQMIGDDFFLSLARWELGFSFDPGHNIQQSGLCVSGMTIAEAADRVMKATYINDRVIVNVGVVDLLHGHDFVDMQQDLLQLRKNLEIRGAYAIFTTLSPLANSSHIAGISDRFNKFNDLIRKLNCPYVDLWKCFVNERNNTLYECFQPGPRRVSGSNKPHVLWNKLGRQRVIKFMKTELAGLI